ncbi:MAG: ABC transporter permease [Aggregatilineales bacterium]
MTTRQYPTRQTRRTMPLDPADLVVIFGFLALIWAFAQIRPAIVAPPVTTIDLAPGNLPYYALRSALRMFAGLFLSIVFTLSYGYAAAKSRRAARVLVPLLDVLQSVPVLGFLSFIVPMLVALSPGSVIGLEFASIFAIFTAQAWNMTFSFYHSLITLPTDMKEAARLYHLPLWQRFIRLEVPSAMIGLIWNGMMSFGGAWFFLAASEAISVNNRNYTLPGVGSYVALAISGQNWGALAWALVTMITMIVLIDQLFWRPLVAWTERFKFEESESGDAAQSWFLDLLKRSQILSRGSAALSPLTEWIGNRLAKVTIPRERVTVNVQRQERIDQTYNGVLIVGLIAAVIYLVVFIHNGGIMLDEVAKVLVYGLITFVRVMVLIVVAALIWTPIGVYIGLHPRFSQYAQPVVQILASFPANFLFPLATIFFLQAHISINIGGILLMALGTQWYILFNSIAGAIALPNDLREMATNMGLRGWRKWRDVLLPGIFPAWVTGAITASGGAWNASIVAEIVTWGSTTLTATGLGAYVAQQSASGDSARLVLGISVMSLFVVGVNRLFWQRLYHLAETRYRIGA